jgi:predicted nucleic acid-binding Zn ribbon protein
MNQEPNQQQSDFQCGFCQKPLRGRTDKKFCNDQCRNTYNNQRNRTDNNRIRNIRLALIRNRRIMKDLLEQQHITLIKRKELLILGFAFEFHTQTIPNPKGGLTYYSFDYGFSEGNNDLIRLTQLKPSHER